MDSFIHSSFPPCVDSIEDASLRSCRMCLVNTIIHNFLSCLSNEFFFRTFIFFWVPVLAFWGKGGVWVLIWISNKLPYLLRSPSHPCSCFVRFHLPLQSLHATLPRIVIITMFKRNASEFSIRQCRVLLMNRWEGEK